jgi:hypothetical protein
MRVIEGLYDGFLRQELDNLAAETAASMTIAHPDYAVGGELRSQIYTRTLKNHSLRR